MAGSTVDTGFGVTLVFATSGFTGELIDIGLSGMARESVETTHHGTTLASTDEFGSETFIPADISDPGTYDIQIATNTGQSGITAQPPIDQPAEVITFTFPATGSETPAKYVGTGFVIDAALAAPMKDRVVWDMTVKLSGVQAVTAAV